MTHRRHNGRFNTSHHLTEAVRALAFEGFAGPDARQKDTWESGRCGSTWEVPRSFRRVTAAMLDEPLEDYDADDLQAFFVERDLGGLFPGWSEDDLQAICENGKIPSCPRWVDRLHSGDQPRQRGGSPSCPPRAP